jgi:5-methylcytosine-specific restriction endonuclease McrA
VIAAEVKICNCKNCGRAFETTHRRKFCNVVCKMAKHRARYERHVHTTKRHRRRMQMQGTALPCEDITVAGLHARDRGVCHLIDHLIPLSKGGSHQWSNVALAHFGCNCRKCDADEVAILVLGM